ncbi:DUF4132 domain-containing protein [Emticicia soli]|uniref:DUF4132 domain-containing protein n=1 Tax=Emticicia soli TaxID=2027878 RepID=A0ABW5J5H9_9BACT
MRLTERQERIEVVKEEIRKVSWNAQELELGNQILAYASDKQAPFPTAPLPFNMYKIGNSVFILNNIDEWDSEDEHLLAFFTHPDYWKIPPSYGFYKVFFLFINSNIDNEHLNSVNVIDRLLEYWHKYQLNEEEILEGIVKHIPAYNWFKNGKMTSAGKYLLERTEKDFTHVIKLFNSSNEHQLLDFLAKTDAEFIDKLVSYFLSIRQYANGPKFISWVCADILLTKNASKYEPYILEKFNEVDSPECIHHLSELLLKHFPEKYKSDISKFSYRFLETTKFQIETQKNSYDEPYMRIQYESPKSYKYVSFTEFHIKKLFDLEGEETLAYMGELFGYREQMRIKIDLLKLFLGYYKEKFLPYLAANGFSIEDVYMIEAYYKELFKSLKDIDFALYEAKIWELCRHKSKKIREMTAVLVAKQGEKAIQGATKLLNDKKGEARQIGALILSLIKTDKAQAILLETIDSEKNDDARDVMLESLAGILPVPNDENKIKLTIEKAAKRSKLNQPLEIWLDETQLSKLYWLSGEECTVETIRFLLYRQSRVKDIRIDIEAKFLLDFIDKTKSQPFAKALLSSYVTNSADAKYKFCLTLSSILGTDEEIDVLKNKVVEWSDAGRGKMGEYAVKALALNGSNKALRAVEFFSRKYKNKYKNIGAAANESFALVAEELNIHPYELADSIIPDFGFTGLFKEFEVNGEPYRAFVNNDFKMAFLNEDSKLLKSLPKGTSKELQDEFKEIAKEIRDIVKSQSSRLEQYLVIQRKWAAEKWQAFFLENPVMFAYAIRLIWGVYQDNKLVSTFRCQEDQTLVNEDGDEISLDNDTQIGIVHPISLNDQQINYWSENLADADIEPIFPQLDRPVILLPDSQKSTRMSNEFEGVQYAGFGFVSKMEKLGWNRGSIVDGGGIASYYKDFSALGITAIIMQEGVLGIGYYEENAELGSLMFVRNKSVSFGSYVYDEPSKEADERLIPFGDVPPIVYSEVVADMQFFRDNDAKKQSN